MACIVQYKPVTQWFFNERWRSIQAFWAFFSGQLSSVCENNHIAKKGKEGERVGFNLKEEYKSLSIVIDTSDPHPQTPIQSTNDPLTLVIRLHLETSKLNSPILTSTA